MILLIGMATAVQAVPPMKWESLMLMKVAAQKGDPEAQFLVGVQYRVGDGFERDQAEAAKWLRKAAESGHVEAQYALGELYADADPGSEFADPDEALKWLQAAAAKGNPDALSRLGALLAKDPAKGRYMAEENRGQPKPPSGAKKVELGASGSPNLPATQSREMDEDPADTVRWSLLLSGLRGADAFLVRGFLLENGIVVNRDLAAAADNYRKAAKLGDARAQLKLGLMYAEGRGVAKDPIEAGAWLGQAASNGSAEATDALARLKATLPLEKVGASASEAQEKAGPAKKP